MTDTSWHADAHLLEQYAAGGLEYPAQAAVETHLTGCATCRATAGRVGDPTMLEPVWAQVATRIAAPRLPLPLRLLARLGVPDGDLIVLKVSTNLLVPFALALLGAVVFAIVGGFLGGDQQRIFYLAVAPLLPVALVGGAYDTTDSLRELAEPTTFSKIRIALLRSAAAISFAVPLALLMGLVPNVALSATAWLVPSLALTMCALTLFTWLAPHTVVLALSAAWLAVVAGVSVGGSASVASQAWFQLVFLAVLLAAAAVFAHRLRAFSWKGAR